MLIDFCHHSVKPKIKCNKVSFDGYEISNLVSGCSNLKSKGFISDNFVKPPVNITVQFPCNICIYRIVIDPVIGQQQSCDVKLFTASYQGIDPWLHDDKPACKERDMNTDGLIFNYIGSSTQELPALTCYQNNLFRDRGHWNRDSLEQQSSYPVVVQLKGKKLSSLFNVSHLSVNVMRAKGGKSVAIKRLEIWGMPSRNVTDKAQQLLLLTYQKSIRRTRGNCTTVADNRAENTVQTETKDVKNLDFISYGEVEVPEDFVDQITFEIMAVPMLLPCGKNIDQSTLERFINIEASWGRRPSDPFTGVAFSSTSQAVPNSALKSRIDKFVTQHSSLNVARTLGKQQHSVDSGHKCSKIVSTDSEPIVLSQSSLAQHNKLGRDYSVSKSLQPSSTQSVTVHHDYTLPEDDYRNKIFNSTYKTQVNQRKRKFSPERNVNIEIETCKSSSKLLKLVPNKYEESFSGYPKSSVAHLPTQLSSPSLNSTDPTSEYSLLNDRPKEHFSVKPSQQKHSQSLSSSLDSALLSTLTSLPSFTKLSKQKEDERTSSFLMEKSCCVCSKDSETVLYKLPCQHLMCRQCLQKCYGKISCKTCSTQCATKDIVRVFT